jgi:hypothetical protein
MSWSDTARAMQPEIQGNPRSGGQEGTGQGNIPFAPGLMKKGPAAQQPMGPQGGQGGAGFGGFTPPTAAPSGPPSPGGAPTGGGAGGPVDPQAAQATLQFTQNLLQALTDLAQSNQMGIFNRQ